MPREQVEGSTCEPNFGLCPSPARQSAKRARDPCPLRSRRDAERSDRRGQDNARADWLARSRCTFTPTHPLKLTYPHTHECWCFVSENPPTHTQKSTHTHSKTHTHTLKNPPTHTQKSTHTHPHTPVKTNKHTHSNPHRFDNACPCHPAASPTRRHITLLCPRLALTSTSRSPF
jgi:hypothetical protein